MKLSRDIAKLIAFVLLLICQVQTQYFLHKSYDRERRMHAMVDQMIATDKQQEATIKQVNRAEFLCGMECEFQAITMNLLSYGHNGERNVRAMIADMGEIQKLSFQLRASNCPASTSFPTNMAISVGEVYPLK